MIKKFSGLINESKYQEVKSKYHSIGEYIEEISKGNEYLLSIVSNYINDVDTDIRISNAVNLLGEFDKKQLFYRIYNYLKKGEEEKDINISTNVVFENALPNVSGGKNLFVSFLKCITALGFKSISKPESSQDGFLLYYLANGVDVKSLKLVFNRFQSLNMFIDRSDYTFDTCGLYFGIKNNSMFEYGFYTDKNIQIGEFSINKSTLNWLMLLQSPSANSLKHDIIHLDSKKIFIFGKIATEMKTYPITAQSKVGPVIKDESIKFGYYGVGKWNNGRLDDNDYMNLKSDFKLWLAKYKWSSSILINISTEIPFWVYFNIKIK